MLLVYYGFFLLNSFEKSNIEPTRCATYHTLLSTFNCNSIMDLDKIIMEFEQSILPYLYTLRHTPLPTPFHTPTPLHTSLYLSSHFPPPLSLYRTRTYICFP